MMGDFGRTEPGESQGLLDSPFTSGSSNRKAVSLPLLHRAGAKRPHPSTSQ